MSWRQAVRAFLHSGTVISMAGGLIATGSYVVYKDWTRYPRMMDTYARGSILPPMAENAYETVYFSRPALEKVNVISGNRCKDFREQFRRMLLHVTTLNIHEEFFM
jgi:hypothetical protein